MSRVGLSIDSSSESCESDLSDSEASFTMWRTSRHEMTLPSRGVTLSLDTTELGSPLRKSNLRSISLPQFSSDGSNQTSSFRSRMHRRLERLRAEEEESEGVEVLRHPRVPVRLCFILCALTLLSMSLIRTEGATRPPLLDVRREEIVFPLHQPQSSSQAKRPSIRSEQLPKYYLPKLELEGPPSATEATRNSKHRFNVAMARSQERRPVFEPNVVDRKVERFVLDNTKINPHATALQPPTTSWTSVLAALALVGMLVETGYKEYRRCRINTSLEEQRRL
jgi:hypothetical protein